MRRYDRARSVHMHSFLTHRCQQLESSRNALNVSMAGHAATQADIKEAKAALESRGRFERVSCMCIHRLRLSVIIGVE